MASNASPGTSSLGTTSNDDETEACTPEYDPLKDQLVRRSRKNENDEVKVLPLQMVVVSC